jgi:beta-fructofuranosidase
MYAGRGFRASEIGDVDVVWHDGLFHLFHLVLPNHDYIAHAVSEDGLAWSRVQNALFISDPGAWDDDMLWTMHVTPDPHRAGSWRMFYTGLCRREQGRVQRIGLARSTDLYHWERDRSDAWPLEISGEHYEHTLDEGRHWVSFRDPFYVRHGDRGYLLTAGRVKDGPLIRRGCVALAEEVAPDRFEFHPPLCHPQRYDDVEVPGAFTMDGRVYLIGSIREDVKVHYWYADAFGGSYRNYSDNVLLPQGNYAARICRVGDTVLVWNFFFTGARVNGDHLLPPPKEIEADETGELRLLSFGGFDDKAVEARAGREIGPITPLFGTPGAHCDEGDGRCLLEARSGMEVFLLAGEHRDFRLGGILDLTVRGKLGLVVHIDEAGDGYYVSLDLAKGIAQIRYWAANLSGGFEERFEYRQLQAAHFVPRPGPVPFSVIGYGSYLEVSLFGEVMLTLADESRRQGRVGFYAESARFEVSDLVLETLSSPREDAYVAQDPVLGT